MILLKNGTLIDPAADREGKFDLLIDGEKIADVQPAGQIPDSTARKIIDTGGKWLLPGLIDMHVHLREPGYEWKETVASGARCAVSGGFTTVCCMANTEPANDCAETTRYILDKAKEAAAAKVLPMGAVSIGCQGKVMAPLSELRKAGCAAFSDDGHAVCDTGLMRRVLEWSLMLDARICCHEEDPALKSHGSMNESYLSTRLGLRGFPGAAEEVMIARDIELARLTGAKIHICHVSTARGVELIRRAKNDGINVTAEVTPHHLLLTEEAVGDYNTLAKMMPPLRQEEDLTALRQGLQDGTIDVIASDHAPHEQDSKTVEFELASSGTIGLQTSLPLVLELVAEGVLTRKRAVEALSSGAAAVLGIEAGSLAAGCAADLTVVDPEHKWLFDSESNLSKSCNSVFIGRTLTGAAETVLVNGKIVVENRELKLEI